MTNSDVLREVIERGFGAGDLSVVNHAGSTIVEHEYLAPQHSSGAATLSAMIESARGEVPGGLTISVDDIVESGDTVWARSTGRGVHPATGEPIEFTVFDVCRFEAGRIVEHWGVPDRFALLHQIGALPPRP